MYQLHISFKLTERTLVLDIGERKDVVAIVKKIMNKSGEDFWVTIVNMNKGLTHVNCYSIESISYFDIEESVRRTTRYQEKSEEWQKDESNKLSAGFASH